MTTQYYPTETERSNGYTDHGAPASLGSGTAGAPSSSKPARVRRSASTLNDQNVRELVAAACEDQIAALHNDAGADERASQVAARQFVIDRLVEAIAELRGV